MSHLPRLGKRPAPSIPTSQLKQPPSSSSTPQFDLRNPSALPGDAPEDDAVLEADEIGKRGLRTKRKAVKIDGYDSDSSNEGFDARADAKAAERDKGKTNGKGKAKSKDEEDTDMFADLEEDVGDAGGSGDDGAADGANAGKKRKRVKFVDVDELEVGQVDSSTTGGRVKADFIAHVQGGANGMDEEEESSESEVSDEVRAEADEEIEDADEVGAGGKKKHAPRLDAFNLNQEKELGGFDEQLNYVRKAVDPDAVHDRWMEGVSKKDIKKAREAQEKRDEEKRRARREDDELIVGDLLQTLIRGLRTGETVLEALARLGPKKQKPKRHWRNKKKGEMRVDKVEEEEDPEEIKRTEAVEEITGAADKLLGKGNHDIYDTERELLMRLYKRETGEDFAEEEDTDGTSEDDDTKQWEYRWSDARDGGETHGPYDGATMNSWNGAGYFGEGVEFRVVGENTWTKDAKF